MSEGDESTSKYFESHKDKKYILDEQDIEKDYIDSVSKSSDTGNRARNCLSGRTSKNELFVNESSSSLIEVRFGKQDLPADKLISDIKYHHLYSQNDNLLYPFNNHLTMHLSTILKNLKLQTAT